MRFIVLSAMTLATLTSTLLAPASVSAQEAGHKIGVVDVAYIFKNHPGIKAQVTAVENNLKAFDAELKDKRAELKAAAEKLKTFKVGSPDYTAQEEKLAAMDSKLRLDMARKKKELADAEARIYFENYQRISAGVKYLANYYKVNLVLRYNSEEMDQAKGESVIRGVMKNIVYHDESLDMTQGVMQYLDQVAAKENATRR